MSKFLRFAVLVAVAVTIYGQVDTGSISGFVKDQSGAVLQNAAVKLENTATSTSVRVTTNGSGFYSAPDLKSGVYQIEASSPGFETLTKKALKYASRIGFRSIFS